jgi:L-alanine-DL-glutamate epimerase-like enolase superfamily enzyme
MPKKGKKSEVERMADRVNTASSPSQLKITDLRVTRIAAPYDYIIIRIDTNQGVYGIGECHESSHSIDPLKYKSLLLGQNPRNVDMLWNAIKPYGAFRSEGGGVSGIETALMDLVGKVYGIPCWQLLGGKYRDSIRLYADTPEPEEATPEKIAEVVVGRQKMGLTVVKFDLGLGGLRGQVPQDGVMGTRAKDDYGLALRGRARGHFGTQLTDEGLDRFVEIVATVRAAVGPVLPIAMDHFGPLTIKDGIRLGRALEGFGVAWLEDIMPVDDVEANRLVTEAIDVPTLNGEQAYLLEGLKDMIEMRAVDILQPDLATVGGLRETKKVADYAEKFDIPTVLHSAGSPIMFMANIHAAAAIRSFMCQEIHSLDIPFWRDLVTGLPDPLIVDGYVAVPEAPGLGIDFNEEVMREHLRTPGPGYFEPTEDWNTPKLAWWIPKEGETTKID